MNVHWKNWCGNCVQLTNFCIASRFFIYIRRQLAIRGGYTPVYDWIRSSYISQYEYSTYTSWYLPKKTFYISIRSRFKKVQIFPSFLYRHTCTLCIERVLSIHYLKTNMYIVYAYEASYVNMVLYTHTDVFTHMPWSMRLNRLSVVISNLSFGLSLLSLT